MRILVLGGTQFLGRHTVDAALARGHDVTMFNRGQTRPELFPDVEKLRGDRDGDLDALRGREFDAVVDTSGYVPRIVRETIDALGDVGHYTFVSSISVYADASTPPTESSPVAELTEPTEEWREAYGELKADCEDVVRERFPNAFIPRPGLIVGPWDPTGRFTYWPQRFADGGRVLAPAPPDADAQVIDARDLADWIVRAAESGLAGTYNAVDRPIPRATARRDMPARRRRRRGDRVGRRRVPRRARGRRVDGAAALADRSGIRGDALGRPVGRVRRRPRSRGRSRRRVRDTLAWVAAGDAPTETPAGLDRAKEQAVLDAWLSKRLVSKDLFR